MTDEPQYPFNRLPRRALRDPWDLWFLFCLVLLFGEPALAVAEGSPSYWRALVTVSATFGAMTVLLLGVLAARRLRIRLRDRKPR